MGTCLFHKYVGEKHMKNHGLAHYICMLLREEYCEHIVVGNTYVLIEMLK